MEVIIMRDFQNAYPNDGYTKFDKEYSCWANNHNGWRKAKKKWRKIGKKRVRDQTRIFWKWSHMPHVSRC